MCLTDVNWSVPVPLPAQWLWQVSEDPLSEMVSVCVHLCLYMYVRVCVWGRVCVCPVCICVTVLVSFCVCTCLRVAVCMCVHVSESGSVRMSARAQEWWWACMCLCVQQVCAPRWWQQGGFWSGEGWHPWVLLAAIMILALAGAPSSPPALVRRPVPPAHVPHLAPLTFAGGQHQLGLGPHHVQHGGRALTQQHALDAQLVAGDGTDRDQWPESPPRPCQRGTQHRALAWVVGKGRGFPLPAPSNRHPPGPAQSGIQLLQRPRASHFEGKDWGQGSSDV